MRVRVIKCAGNPSAVGLEYDAPKFPRGAGELSSRVFSQQSDGTWANDGGTAVVVISPNAAVPCSWPTCACIEAVRCPGAVPRLAATAEPAQVADQAFKADDGKPNWFLLMSGKGCAAALAGVVRVLSFAVRPTAGGGKGYTEHSWRLVPNAKERYEAALYRHLNKLALGEAVDDESGESHWDHVATNALFLSELTKADK